MFVFATNTMFGNKGPMNYIVSLYSTIFGGLELNKILPNEEKASVFLRLNSELHLYRYFASRMVSSLYVSAGHFLVLKWFTKTNTDVYCSCNSTGKRSICHHHHL